MLYYIDYGTGVGDFTFEGTLEEAKKEAEKNISYTQESVLIRDAETWDLISILLWWGYEADTEIDMPYIDYGKFGFYVKWYDC